MISAISSLLAVGISCSSPPAIAHAIVATPYPDAWKREVNQLTEDVSGLESVAAERRALVKLDGDTLFVVDEQTLDIGRIRDYIDGMRLLTSVTRDGVIRMRDLKPADRLALIRLTGAHMEILGPYMFRGDDIQIVANQRANFTYQGKTHYMEYRPPGSPTRDLLPRPNSVSEAEKREFERAMPPVPSGSPLRGIAFLWAGQALTATQRTQRIAKLTSWLEAEVDAQNTAYRMAREAMVKSVWAGAIQLPNNAALKDLPPEGRSELEGWLKVHFSSEADRQAFRANAQTTAVFPTVSLVVRTDGKNRIAGEYSLAVSAHRGF